VRETHGVQEPWEDPDWLSTAIAWVDGRLDAAGRSRVGDPDQVHVRPWSTVIRVPTADGDVWFKANTPELRHEAVVALLLARRAPDRVPPLIADDPDRGWMLMEDGGRRLREVIAEERDMSRWDDVIEGAADIARAMEPDVDELLAAGVPDLRLATLPDRYAALVDDDEIEQRFRDAVPRVREMSEELASYGVVETLQHDDLHDGQVFVRGDRQLILDWGDCVISHPFFTLSVTLEGVVAWGLDDVENAVDLDPLIERYLRRYDPQRPELREAVPLALRLGWVCRAVNATVMEDAGSTRTRLRMFLDGRP
jgi:pimeloyl-ACP methyl ester carboxylesterase